MVRHTCNPSTTEPEAGGSRVPGQPELYNEIQSQKNERKKRKKSVHKVFA
jgi:hypothetical protein